MAVFMRPSERKLDERDVRLIEVLCAELGCLSENVPGRTRWCGGEEYIHEELTQTKFGADMTKDYFYDDYKLLLHNINSSNDNNNDKLLLL